jgi:hypothetical protein
MAKDKTDVRILVANDVDGKRYQPNQLVRFDAAVAKNLVKDGKADDSKEGIEYLAADGVKLVEHAKVDEEKQQATD